MDTSTGLRQDAGKIVGKGGNVELEKGNVEVHVMLCNYIRQYNSTIHSFM